MMQPNETGKSRDGVARVVAAIDIGSNALRMVIAEVCVDGRIEVLERLQRAVRLGQDAFRRSRIGAQSMRATIEVLRDYRQLLELYHVEETRVVTTSAVRESLNADTFVDRIFMATGLNVEVIATSEESRLTVSAVRHAVGNESAINERETLIAEVGGGSTLLTILDDGEITNSQGLRLGSVRLQELLSTSNESPERLTQMLRHHIQNVVATAQGSLPLASVETFVAIGGDARFAAREVGHPADTPDLHVVTRDDFNRLVDQCTRQSAEELGRSHGLPFADAETLNPALLVYQVLLERTQASELLVSNVSLRDGLLLELARHVTGEEDEGIKEGIIHSAMALGAKYRVDVTHATRVAEFAIRLFDEMQADHGLKSRQRLLLHVAALLHEVGGYVTSQAHHKHSYYLIKHSEIFGLAPAEVDLVAHIARYHRRSPPKQSHTEYMGLPRESRIVVSKLSAILRVADALMRGQVGQEPLPFERRGDDLVVYVSGRTNLLLEQRALASKGDLFEDIYGMKVRLEEA